MGKRRGRFAVWNGNKTVIWNKQQAKQQIATKKYKKIDKKQHNDKINVSKSNNSYIW